MTNIFKGQVLISGGLLVGYCLAYPVILAKYFYDKPAIDFVVYGVLFVAAFYAFWKLLSRKAWFKNWALVLMTLPLVWLKFEYWLYGEIDSPQFVTYLLLIILAGGMGAIMRFKLLPKESRWFKLMVIPTTIIGFIISYFSREHSFNELLVLFFALGLASCYWEKSKVNASAIFILGLAFNVILTLLEPPQFFERQAKYHDKVVFSQTTDLQIIDVTEWRGNHWFYADGINQFSSIDSWLFYEPFVYPVLQLKNPNPKVLVIGGENGMLVNELKKGGLSKIELIAIDEELLSMAQNEVIFKNENQGSLNDPSLILHSGDVFTYLSEANTTYDIIFVDVSDPIDLERNQYFTKEFYDLIRLNLGPNGLFVTQSGSPYFATTAFEVVQETILASGYEILSFHNQILTLGEWSWTIGSVSSTTEDLKETLASSNFNQYETLWLNQEAMQMMLSFGKSTRVINDLQVNTMANPVLYQYYLNGNYTLK